MAVSRDNNSIISVDAVAKNACGRVTGNNFITSHGLSSSTIVNLSERHGDTPLHDVFNTTKALLMEIII